MDTGFQWNLWGILYLYEDAGCDISLHFVAERIKIGLFLRLFLVIIIIAAFMLFIISGIQVDLFYAGGEQQHTDTIKYQFMVHICSFIYFSYIRLKV